MLIKICSKLVCNLIIIANYDDGNDDEVIEWYKGYQSRKAQKASIKEGLLLIA